MLEYKEKIMTLYEARKDIEAQNSIKKSQELKKEFKNDWVKKSTVKTYKRRQSTNQARIAIILDCLNTINSVLPVVTMKFVKGRGLVAVKGSKELGVVFDSKDLVEILSFVSEKRNELIKK